MLPPSDGSDRRDPQPSRSHRHHDHRAPAYLARTPTCSLATRRTMDTLEQSGAVVLNDTEDLEIASAVVAHLDVLRRWRRRVHSSRCGRRRRYRGSVPGRRPNKQRNFAVGLRALLRDYFGVDGQPPVYDENDFERRFCVPRSVFLRIYRGVRELLCFRQSTNATGQTQAHQLLKLVACFRVLAYGSATDREDKYFRLTRSTVDFYLCKLVEFIVTEFEPEFLRPPNDAELRHLLRRNAERGLPGCIGSLDCSHWEWRACPKGLAGVYQNRKQRRSIVMKTVCDEDLYIWHFFAGCPGSFNDLNVMQQSPLYQNITASLWPPRRYIFTANGRGRTLLYYLVDSIYAHYPFFVRPYPKQSTRKHKTFNRLQEALRKDAERLYAVLTAFPYRFAPRAYVICCPADHCGPDGCYFA